MKTTKLLLAGVLAMGLIHTASAVTEIRLTGSTAFRSAVVNSIEDILNSDYVWASANGAANGNQQVFIGTTKTGSIQVIIKTSWSGSAGGVFSLATNSAAGQPFSVDPTGVSFSPAAGTIGGVALTHAAGAVIPAGSITESHTADVALSDAFASTTPYTGAGFTALKDTIVGIVPFEFVAASYSPDGSTLVAGAYPGVTDISTDQAQALLGGGLALNQFTSNPADQAVFVQCIGRDHDSGTRIGALYDTQYLGDIYGNPTDGFNDSVLQYIPNGATVGATQFAAQSPGTGLITSLSPWPVESVLGGSRPLGSEGFFSGGNVAKAIARGVDITQGNYVIAYLGMSDANTVNPGTGYSYTDGGGRTATVTPSQNALTFNGYYPGTAAHPFGPPYTNIIQGKYTFWGYEHYLYATSFSGTPKTVADQISSQLTTEADFQGIGVLLSAMNSSRAGDGLTVTSP